MRKIIDLKGNHRIAFISNIEKLSEVECRTCVDLARNKNMVFLLCIRFFRSKVLTVFHLEITNNIGHK